MATGSLDNFFENIPRTKSPTVACPHGPLLTTSLEFSVSGIMCLKLQVSIYHVVSTLYGSLYLFWNLKKAPENALCFGLIWASACKLVLNKDQQLTTWWGQRAVRAGECHWRVILALVGGSHKETEPLNLLSVFKSFHSSLSFYWLLPSRLYSQNYHQIFLYGRKKKCWPYRH